MNNPTIAFMMAMAGGEKKGIEEEILVILKGSV